MVTFTETASIKEFEIPEEELIGKKTAYRRIANNRKYNFMMRTFEQKHSRDLWDVYHVGETPPERKMVLTSCLKNSRFNVVVETTEPPAKPGHQDCFFQLSRTDAVDGSYHPEKLSRKEVVKYILEMGDVPYLEANGLNKSNEYICRHFKIKDLYKHYHWILDVNEDDLYS
jgi:hypothetical protein